MIAKVFYYIAYMLGQHYECYMGAEQFKPHIQLMHHICMVTYYMRITVRCGMRSIQNFTELTYASYIVY